MYSKSLKELTDFLTIAAMHIQTKKLRKILTQKHSLKRNISKLIKN